MCMIGWCRHTAILSAKFNTTTTHDHLRLPTEPRPLFTWAAPIEMPLGRAHAHLESLRLLQPDSLRCSSILLW
jgi:hypothetical protein